MIKIEHIPVHSKDRILDLYSIDISIDCNLVENLIPILEKTVCQVKEMLRAQDHKQKTWDQKVENQVVQLEQENSTHNNDQKLQEKEQSQRTVKTSDILLMRVVSYISSTVVWRLQCPVDEYESGIECMKNLMHSSTVAVPNHWKLTMERLS